MSAPIKQAFSPSTDFNKVIFPDQRYEVSTDGQSQYHVRQFLFVRPEQYQYSTVTAAQAVFFTHRGSDTGRAILNCSPFFVLFLTMLCPRPNALRPEVPAVLVLCARLYCFSYTSTLMVV